jgi:hypothetical protein
VHHHEADHDGTVAHLEVPHGGHDSPAPELYERVTSSGPDAPAVDLPSQAPMLHSGVVARVGAARQQHAHHPARPPPSTRRSRAPPFGS